MKSILVTDCTEYHRIYTIDERRLEQKLGLKADGNFDSRIVKTIKWYLKKYVI